MLFVKLQCAFHRPRVGKRESKDTSVDDGLTAGLSSDRQHRMSRISQQRHAIEAPPRKRVAITLGKFVDFIGVADQIGELDPAEIPLTIRRAGANSAMHDCAASALGRTGTSKQRTIT